MYGKRRIRTTFIILALGLVLIGTSGNAWAQLKVYARVLPNQDETLEPLVVDVNQEPSDNVTPNIIIAADEKRGFVAYTGSGVVLEFSLETGEVLNRIETGGMPLYGTVLPDHRSLLVVSAWDSRIFVIDMDSEPSRQVATYSFANAQFGFGSMITLSPDGTTGYVSSTGTSEVIKFNAANGQESGRFKSGMRLPAQVTVTPDGATLIVVDTDIGKPEVAFFNTQTYAKKGSLTNPDPTLYYVAFTIANKAVVAPDGKTGIIASRGQNNVLYKELVFLFDATNGKILKTGETGPAPGYTTITPDGKLFVIMNMFSLTVIPTDDFDLLTEFQASAGDPIVSTNLVITPDSRFAYYAASSSDEIVQIDLTDGANLERLLVGDETNSYIDQPAGMAMADGGKIITSLEFGSGIIDLMTPITMRAAARFQSSPEYFTGLSLINLSPKTNNVTVYAMQDFGELNRETDVVNPVTFELAPNEQISLTVAEIFNFDDENAPNDERTGWISIFSDEPEVTGFVIIGKKDLTNLNGLTLDSGRIYDCVIPEIDRTGEGYIQLSLLNPTYYTVYYQIVRVAKEGLVIDTRTKDAIAGNSRQPWDYTDLFPRTDVEREGYLWMTSPEGFVPSEIYTLGATIESIKAIDRKKFNDIYKIYSPQFVNLPGWKTTLNLINAGEEAAEVTVTLYDADGLILGQIEKSFTAGEQLKDDLANIFADFPAAMNATGWIAVESTQPRMLGLMTFSAEDNRYAASVELSGTPLDRFLFPVVAHNDSYLTALALLNSDSDAAANVIVEVWGKDGAKLEETAITLPALSRTAVYLDSLFPDMDPLLLGNLRVRSDKGIYGFSIMSDPGFAFLMLMPAVPLF